MFRLRNFIDRVVHSVFGYAVIACLVALSTVCLISLPAFADDAATAVAAAAGSGLTSGIISTLIAAVPGAIIALWALFKAYAAHSEATWDDWMVAQVEKTARGILEKAGWTLTPPSGPSKTP